MSKRINGELIKVTRLYKGWTQEVLADKASVGVRTIKRIEKGESVRSSNSLAVALALGVEHEQLFSLPTEPINEVSDPLSASTPEEMLRRRSLVDTDALKKKVYVAASQAIAQGNVLEHYCQEFCQAIGDLSFKDLDFLVSLQDGLVRSVERHRQWIAEKKTRPNLEATIKNYLHCHTVNRLHAPQVNRLLYHGALSQPLADIPSRLTPFGDLLYKAVGQAVREVAEEITNNYWQANRLRVFTNSLNVRTGKLEDMGPPEGGWPKENLRRAARPWVGNLLNG
jgi:transcriptional regulator with XRE-family HTH domain